MTSCSRGWSTNSGTAESPHRHNSALSTSRCRCVCACVAHRLNELDALLSPAAAVDLNADLMAICIARIPSRVDDNYTNDVDLHSVEMEYSSNRIGGIHGHLQRRRTKPRELTSARRGGYGPLSCEALSIALATSAQSSLTHDRYAPPH